MPDKPRTVDSIENDAPVVRAEETDGKHIVVSDTNSHGREFRGDVPLNQESIAVRLDDDCASIDAAVSSRPLALIDTREGNGIGCGR
jgi:hypothetical protein